MKGEIYLITKKVYVRIDKAKAIATNVTLTFETEDGLLVTVIAPEMEISQERLPI
jgi:hypothetical protein